jgi:ribosomal protein S18 acetylase RimI-like enzyme
MFYKEKLISNDLKEKFTKNFSLEFALALKNQLKDKEIKVYTLVNKANQESLQYFATEKEAVYQFADMELSKKILLEEFESKNNCNVVWKELEELPIINKEAYKEAQDLVLGFNVLVEELTVQDNKGEDYTIKIYENTDSKLTDSAVQQDLLHIFKGNTKIGYIKALYTSNEMYNAHYPTKIHEHYESINKDNFLGINLTKKEILEKVESTGLIRNVDYEDIKKSFKKLVKKISENVDLKYLQESKGRAISEYTKIGTEVSMDYEEDTMYRGRGLAQLMNFYLARHFSRKDIKMVSSLNQTDDAKKMWENLSKNLSKNVTFQTKTYYGRDKKQYSLKVSEEEELNFKDGKMQHTNKINDLLKKKEKVNKIKYHKVESENLNDFMSQYKRFPKREFISNNKTHFLATSDDQVVGYAILVNKSKTKMNNLKDVLMLSNIEVGTDFRNIGIATNLIDMIIKESKEKNKILLRTRPDELGELYVYDQITNKLNSNTVDNIPYNLDFIYYILEREGILTNKSNAEKIQELNSLSLKILNHEVCKQYDIDELEKLNMNFLKEATEVFKTEYKVKSKVKLKR